MLELKGCVSVALIAAVVLLPGTGQAGPEPDEVVNPLTADIPLGPLLFGAGAVSTVLLLGNGGCATSGERCPTAFRIAGGVVGAAEIGVGIHWLWEGWRRDALIAGGIGSLLVVSAAAAGGWGEDKSATVVPTSDGAVATMSWRF